MPVTLRLAVGLLWAQFISLLGLLIYFVLLVIGETTPLGIYVAVFGLGLAVAFFIATRMLQHRRVGGRGGAIALQLLLLAPVYYMIIDRFWLGWVLAAVILVVLGLLAAPSTGKALIR